MKYMLIGKLQAGDCFETNNSFYIKTDRHNEIECLCVELTTGKIEEMYMELDVLFHPEVKVVYKQA